MVCNLQGKGGHQYKKVTKLRTFSVWGGGGSTRGRSKVRVLTEISLIFLSQTDTFNASSSLKKNCNKFMY